MTFIQKLAIPLTEVLPSTMASLGDHNSSQPSQAVQQRIFSQLQGDWVERLSVEQMFILIDRVLPFEACLHYQILPLFLEGSLLHLGMVNPRDPAAASYVRRILSYLNYSLMPRSISSEALQVTLTAYLSHIGQQTTGRTSFSHSPDAIASHARNSHKPAEISAPRGLSLLESLPVLTVQAHHSDSPLQTLIGMPPTELLQELLVRVLAEGIGRLYFECHANYGRILWSQDGVLQSVLEGLPLILLRGMVNELKQIVHLPPQPVLQIQQTEAEYLYDRHRILLCCRFIPSRHGEEATVQVLRGAALKFYQQQQVFKLERDALSIAKQLQNKLKEIRDRTYAEPGLASARFEALPALSQLLQGMEELLDDLGIQKTAE